MGQRANRKQLVDRVMGQFVGDLAQDLGAKSASVMPMSVASQLAHQIFAPVNDVDAVSEVTSEGEQIALDENLSARARREQG